MNIGRVLIEQHSEMIVNTRKRCLKIFRNFKEMLHANSKKLVHIRSGISAQKMLASLVHFFKFPHADIQPVIEVKSELQIEVVAIGYVDFQGVRNFVQA